MGRVQDKVALISGVARGRGRSRAVKLARVVEEGVITGSTVMVDAGFTNR